MTYIAKKRGQKAVGPTLKMVMAQFDRKHERKPPTVRRTRRARLSDFVGC